MAKKEIDPRCRICGSWKHPTRYCEKQEADTLRNQQAKKRA